MTRLSTSRPKRSVPKSAWSPGRASMRSKFCSSGGCGARVLAKSAMPTITSAKTAPTTTTVLRATRRSPFVTDLREEQPRRGSSATHGEPTLEEQEPGQEDHHQDQRLTGPVPHVAVSPVSLFPGRGYVPPEHLRKGAATQAISDPKAGTAVYFRRWRDSDVRPEEGTHEDRRRDRRDPQARRRPVPERVPDDARHRRHRRPGYPVRAVPPGAGRRRHRRWVHPHHQRPA